MSEKYLPLFRKYRPQSFKDVVGQESLVKALTNAIELNRVANAYLFAGPRGTGKTSCARIFAKSLNCKDGPTLEPCQKCPSCLDITNASGLDVIEIDAATNRGIDDAKELIAQTQYAPMNGKYKIFIIDEVHMLSNEAFNALLKTFEEPPANVIFILATTEPHKVIETIVSRCQRFDLRRITTDDITARLRQISDLENIKITDDALYTIAKNVSGGLRDSLALLDQVSILGAREEITKEDIENLLGKVTFDVAFNFLNTILAKNVQKALVEIDEIYTKGLEPKNFCENFIEFLRNLIFAINSDNENQILKFTNFNKCDIEKIKSQNFSSKNVFAILAQIIDYYKEIRFSTNPYLWTELLLIDLCNGSGAKIAQNEPVFSASSPVPQAISQIQTDKKPIPQAFMANEQKTAQIKPEIPSKPAPFLENKVQPVSNGVKNEAKKQDEIQAESVIQEEKQAEIKENKVYSKEEISSNAAAQDFDSLENPKSPAAQEKDETQTSAQFSSTGENPVAVWTNVLNTIESPPAKFFYSDVAKLVKIEDKRIVLGFVNDNVISQAKSDMKLGRLKAAMDKVLGQGYVVDFILLTPDVKVMDVKIAAKPSGSRAAMNAVPQDVMQNEAYSAPEGYLPQNQSPASDLSIQNSSNSDTATQTPASKPAQSRNYAAKKSLTPPPPKQNQANLENYTRKTREMLEIFNGKIVE